MVVRASLHEQNVELLSKLITDAAAAWEQPAILTLAFVRNTDDDGDVDGGVFMSKLSRQTSRQAKGETNGADDAADDENNSDDGIDVEKLAAVTAAVAKARGNDALVTRDSTRDEALEKKIAEENRRQRKEAEKRAKKRAEKAAQKAAQKASKKEKSVTRQASKQAPGVDALNAIVDSDDDDDDGADQEDVLSPRWFQVLSRLDKDVSALPDVACPRLRLTDPENELELVKTLGRGAMGVVRCCFKFFIFYLLLCVFFDAGLESETQRKWPRIGCETIGSEKSVGSERLQSTHHKKALQSVFF